MSSTNLNLGAGAGAPVEQPVSGGSATFTIAKANNGSVEGGIELSSEIRYSDGTLSRPSYMSYALDFKAPTYSSSSLRMKLNGVYADTVSNIAVSTGNWLNGQSPLFADVSDNGVGGVTYQIKVLTSGNTVVATLNPGDTLAAVAEAAVGTYDLQVVGLKDALGNTLTPNPSPLNGAGTYGLDKTAPTLSTTFAANGKVLNGTLGATSTDINFNLTEGGGSGTQGALNGAAPSSSGAGTAGYIIQVAKSGCTYTLNSGGTLPVSSGPGSVRLPDTGALTPSGCSTAYQAPGTAPNSPGDGNHTVTIQVVDEARNVSAPISVNFYWLTAPPTVTFTQALPGGISLGGSSYVLANGSVAINSPVPLLKAILYSTGGASATEVQYVASPLVDINNPGGPLTFNPNGSVSGNFQDFTNSASGFAFQLRFNADGNYKIVASAVPAAYDNTGAINVTGLSNTTSQTVAVVP